MRVQVVSYVRNETEMPSEENLVESNATKVVYADLIEAERTRARQKTVDSEQDIRSLDCMIDVMNAARTFPNFSREIAGVLNLRDNLEFGDRCWFATHNLPLGFRMKIFGAPEKIRTLAMLRGCPFLVETKMLSQIGN